MLNERLAEEDLSSRGGLPPLGQLRVVSPGLAGGGAHTHGPIPHGPAPASALGGGGGQALLTPVRSPTDGHSSVISRGLSMITSRSLCRGVDLADSVRALRSKALASAAVSVSSERPRPF